MDAIAEAFKAYQEKRFEDVVAGCAGASKATAAATWKSMVFKFVDAHAMNRQRVVKYMMEKQAQSIAATPSFEFVQGG